MERYLLSQLAAFVVLSICLCQGATPIKPQNLTWTSSNSSCVTLHWKSAGLVTRFEHRCNNSRWISINQTDIQTATHCDLYPHEVTTCEVRTVYKYDYSNSSKVMVRAGETTDDIVHPVKNVTWSSFNSSCITMRWRYSYSYTKFEHRCNGSAWLPVDRHGYEIKGATYCNLYPGARMSCEVRVLTTEGYSPVTYVQIYTNSSDKDVVHPVKNVTWTSFNSSCITMRWRYSYSYTKFEHRCNDSNWLPVYRQNYDIKAATYCNLYPGALVLCEVRVVTSKGYSVPTKVRIYTMPSGKDDSGNDKKNCTGDAFYITANKNGTGWFSPDLPSGDRVKIQLPIGRYPVEITYGNGSKSCPTTVVVTQSLPRYDIEFQATYKVECKKWEINSVLVSTMVSTARRNIPLLQEICSGVCNLTSLMRWGCDGDLLTINWTTFQEVAGGAPVIPSELSSPVKERLVRKGTYFPVMIISNPVPVVYPIRNQDGSSAKLVLTRKL